MNTFIKIIYTKLLLILFISISCSTEYCLNFILFTDYDCNTSYPWNYSESKFKTITIGTKYNKVIELIGEPFQKENINYLHVIKYSNPKIPTKYFNNPNDIKSNISLLVFINEKGRIINTFNADHTISIEYFIDLSKSNPLESLKHLGEPDYNLMYKDSYLLHYSKQSRICPRPGKFNDYYLKHIILNRDLEVVKIIDIKSFRGKYMYCDMYCGFFE